MIRIVIPFLPPSTNHAYVNNPWGGRTLSSAGKEFKTLTSSHITRNYREACKKIVPNKPYLVLVKLYLSTLENKGWPKKAETRYKHLDATNRVKLLEDALAKAFAVDDSNTLCFVVSKEAGEKEQAIVFIWSIEDEECVLHDFVRHYT
jgi:Holliday junction resolvase RusA-like endonuclease